MKRFIPHDQFNNQRKQPRYNSQDQQQRKGRDFNTNTHPQQRQRNRSTSSDRSSLVAARGPRRSISPDRRHDNRPQYQRYDNPRRYNNPQHFNNGNRGNKNYQYNNRPYNNNNNNRNNNNFNNNNFNRNRGGFNQSHNRNFQDRRGYGRDFDRYDRPGGDRERDNLQDHKFREYRAGFHDDNSYNRSYNHSMSPRSVEELDSRPPEPSTSKRPLPDQANRNQVNQRQNKPLFPQSDIPQRSPRLHNTPPRSLASEQMDEDIPIKPGWHDLPPFDLIKEDERLFETPDTVTEFYDRIGQVGEGTYGKVYKAKNRVSKLHVALKRIRMEQEKDGFPVTALREIKLLQQSHHDNIVRLHEMLVSKGSVYMVFEYMENDLTGLLQHGPDLFQANHKKSLCQQMLAGLSYLHHRGILHRDMKGSNILISNQGVLKLADFGLARFYHKHRTADYTNRVITIWYRPPELLLGATSYGPEVDMWSAGCIMLEIYTTKPVFQGDNEVHQLEIIFKMLGIPSHEDWPGLSNLPWYELVRPSGKPSAERFKETFSKWLTPAGLELAQALLTFNPEKRISAQDALELPFFSSEEPSPALPDHLGELQGEWHEYEAKREKAQARKKQKEENESKEVNYNNNSA
ncbi:Pkinase-domain-containing protein [Wallemia mellicola]|nr:Pkinase-domain-containing protein [Wallemia mellicola]TIB98524.1 Pkinase-domain-containing protein [Wallemia mellicola]TIC08476.1 Pkinase-domain-containing protein [Wallemia mellicola]